LSKPNWKGTFSGSRVVEPVGNNSDVKILQWCLELNHEHPSVVLLSNDMNFCTKATACGIQALPGEQFIDKLRSLVNSLSEKLPVETSIPISSAIKNSEPAHRNETVNQAMDKEAPWPSTFQPGCSLLVSSDCPLVAGESLTYEADLVIESE
jgi:hypothetical protein